MARQRSSLDRSLSTFGEKEGPCDSGCTSRFRTWRARSSWPTTCCWLASRTGTCTSSRERGTDLGELHEASYLQKTDTVHGAFTGLVIGGVIGVLRGRAARELPARPGLAPDLVAVLIAAIVGARPSAPGSRAWWDCRCPTRG